jgi:hypothetical protein
MTAVMVVLCKGYVDLSGRRNDDLFDFYSSQKTQKLS